MNVIYKIIKMLEKDCTLTAKKILEILGDDAILKIHIDGMYIDIKINEAFINQIKGIVC